MEMEVVVVVEVQMDEVMMDIDEEPLLQEEVVQGDIEFVDVLPADAEAVFEFRDIFDVLLPDIDEEFMPIPPRMPIRDRPAGIHHELPERHNIGQLDAICTHCGARHFSCERTLTNHHFTTCCNNGQMAVTGERVLGQPPELLIRLLVDDSQVAKHFRKEIRRYNNTLAFAAFSTDLNPGRLPGRGPRVFTVHGQVYRRICNDVVKNELMQPRYCELYFIESGAANQIRMAQQPRQRPLIEDLLADLDNLLRQNNPFAVAFENMRQVWQREQDAAAANPMLQPRRVTMHIVADPNNDPRRYNQPAAHVNEVAVVFVGEDGLPPGNLDLVIYDSNPVDPNHRMQNISAGSSHADPMLYPLFFPYGETGWHYNLLQEGNRRNTIREFVCYRLAIRYTGTNSNGNEGHTFSLIHAGGFLLQQYMCDQYIRMEANNLRYTRENRPCWTQDHSTINVCRWPLVHETMLPRRNGHCA
ncbi:uncharacterized protein LOC132925861 [Rhopalosiphum padi]|uniref:uncharacterized protein LOC132925861 n=1 Tax=Rhopalosiphum padi TaxID=40932 RepID=UPI00298DA28B|nr:uncharacterized protein LOC132925861 [Rhopalosiphum padi]